MVNCTVGVCIACFWSYVKSKSNSIVGTSAKKNPELFYRETDANKEYSSRSIYIACVSKMFKKKKIEHKNSVKAEFCKMRVFIGIMYNYCNDIMQNGCNDVRWKQCRGDIFESKIVKIKNLKYENNIVRSPKILTTAPLRTTERYRNIFIVIKNHNTGVN